MDGDLLDWELLHGSDSESTDSITSEKKSPSPSVIDDGLVLSHHFSSDTLIRKSSEITDQTQYDVMESGDSSRVDYESEQVQVRGFDQLNVNQSGEDCVRNESGFYDSKNGISGDGEAKLSDFEAVGEKHVEGEAIADGVHIESQSGVEEPVEDSRKSWSDSGGNELVSGDSEVVNGEEEIVSDTGVVSEVSGENSVEAVAVNSAVSSGDESKSKETVWWKTPFVLLKYYAFRIGPVWSVSMAAAVMGLVLLGRRLYNMKKKAQRIQLKVTIDDKKMSRVMNQAARLNEVLTEVRRVPVIRPALPSPGSWPVLSLR